MHSQTTLNYGNTGTPFSSTDSIFDKFSKRYPDTNTSEKVLKYSDFQKLLSSDDLQHNELVYLSQIASYIPLDIPNILFVVSDLDNKGYILKEDFLKFSNQLLSPHSNTDLDIDINKLLFYICKIYEKKTLLSSTRDPSIYSLNAPISQESFIDLVSNYNKTDLPYFQYLLNSNKKSTNLDFQTFCKIMDELPRVKFEQCYENFKNSNNNITPNQLKLIAQNIFYDKLSPIIADHLAIFAQNKYGNEISHDDSYELLRLFRDLPKLNYLTFEKISNTSNDLNLLLTSNGLFNYIQSLPNEKPNHLKSITKDEILLYFAWIRYTSEHLKNNPSIDSDELLAILTDDLVVTNEVSNNLSDSPSHNFLHVFKSLHSFILGSVAGMIGATIVYPIDIVKTRMQNQQGNSLYSSYVDCFKKLIRNEGFLGVYSGLLPQIVGVAPEKAIKLTLNDLIRGIGKKQSANGEITLPWEILAGSTAGLCQVIVTNPLEVSKIRLQIQGEAIRQLKEQGKIVQPKTALDIARELGLRGLYRGAPACLLRDIPFSSIYFPTYANIKKILFGLNPGTPGGKTTLETWELLVSGALAGLPAAFLTTPCDVIKTRIQSKPKPGVEAYRGILPTVKRILAEEGPKAFFKGGVARVCRSSPQFGFTLAAYEVFQKTLPLSMFYDESNNNKMLSSPSSSAIKVPSSSISISENSKRFKLSSSASSSDLNPTLLALTKYYKSLEPETSVESKSKSQSTK